MGVGSEKRRERAPSAPRFVGRSGRSRSSSAPHGMPSAPPGATGKERLRCGKMEFEFKLHFESEQASPASEQSATKAATEGFAQCSGFGVGGGPGGAQGVFAQ